MHASNIRSIIPRTGTINTTPGLYILRCWITMHPQLRSARLHIAQQRSAAQCRAVPCPSFCGAVSCGAMRSFEHTAVVPGVIQVPGTTMYVLCTRLSAFFSCNCPLFVPLFPYPRKYHTYCRSERDIKKRTSQRMAISSAQAPQLSICTN